MNICPRLFRRCAVFSAVLLLALSFCLPAAAERIQLDIANSGVRKLSVAVPTFADGSGGTSTEAGKKIAQLIITALEFHGFVQGIDVGADRNADWRSKGADYVVFGKFTGQGLEASLLDVMAGKMMPAKQFSGSFAQQDDLALRLADALVADFTGEPGVSRTSIAFVSDGTGRKEIYLADVLGRNVRQITRHNHLCVSPRFTPDGTRLAYSSYHRGNQNLYITELSQNDLTRALSRRPGMNLAPAFAPDSQTMVVTLSRDGSPDLYLMDMRGQVIEQLTKGAGINVSPSFSPDGQSLSFVSDRSGKPQIYIMDISSRRTRLLTLEGAENVEPSWSPKGDKIVYTSLRGGRYQIHTIPVSGGSSTQISSGPGDCESPSWSPDGRQIAYSKKRGGQSEICAVFANGRGERRLFRLKGSQSYPRWSPQPNR